MKNTSVKKIFNEFTHSEWVVYLLLIISVINVIAYLHQNNLSAIAIFLAIGFIVSRYTKNMIYVLLSAIVITNLFVSMGYLNSLGQKTKTREGLKMNTKGRSPGTAANLDALQSTGPAERIDAGEGAVGSPSGVASGAIQQIPTAPGIRAELVGDAAAATEKAVSELDEVQDITSTKEKNGSGNITPQDLKQGKKENKTNTKNQEAFAEQMQPFLQQLQKMLGEGGFDMKQLKKQQDDLLNAMQQMKPIIDGAEGMINKVAGGPLGNLLGFKNQN
tara:strand:+ start:7724 stop:8548 length:825 start_codon:yes stop_codon:yes gene_type:complete